MIMGYILTNQHVVQSIDDALRAKSKLNAIKEKYNFEDIIPRRYGFFLERRKNTKLK